VSISAAFLIRDLDMLTPLLGRGWYIVSTNTGDEHGADGDRR
jgi:hypothetical protein